MSLSVRKRYSVVLTSGSAEVEAVEDSDLFFIQKVVQAINHAIDLANHANKPKRPANTLTSRINVRSLI